MPSTPPAADRRTTGAGTARHAAFASKLVALAMLVAAATACGPRSDPGAPAPSPPAVGRTLGAVFQTLENPFFREVNAGLREVVASNGDTLTTLAADWSGPRQKDDVERLIAGGVAALFVNPVDPDVIETSLQKAAGSGVPCVVVDTQMRHREAVACQVLSDNREAGRLAARSLATARRPARIAVLHIPANEACIDRIAGFREIVERLPDVAIIAVEDGGGTRPAADAAMTALLERHPDLDGVFAANDPMALGAVEAIERAGRSNGVAVVSVDGSSEGIAAVQTGRLHSTSMQFPREIGRIAAQRAYEILAGNRVEPDIRVPVELITRENAHTFATAGP